MAKNSTNCHIKRKGYMKNFCDSTNNLHYFKFKDGEYIYDEKNNPRTTKGIGWHPDVYTYFDINDSSNGRIPNKQLEEDLGNIFEKNTLKY